MDNQDKCFRFLINIDKCLNMSVFDIFFYKLECNHCFSLYEVQSFSPETLRTAANSIRMYMKKYPYHVANFRIIVTMRCEYLAKTVSFNNTLLFRILQIKHALNTARIHIGADEVTERALNLIMLYDTDTQSSSSDPDDYLTSTRLSDDLTGLLYEIGVNKCETPEDLRQCLQGICDSPNSVWDPSIVSMLQVFLQGNNIDSLGIVEDESDMDFAEAGEIESFFSKVRTCFLGFLREELAACQVFEKVIDRNNQRLLTRSFLRLVNFINADVTMSDASVGGSHDTQSLSTKCRSAWNRIWELDNNTIEKRYVQVLHSYRVRLERASKDLDFRDVSGTSDGSDQKIPSYEIPKEDAIVCEQSQYYTDHKYRPLETQNKHYRTFVLKRLTPGKVLDEWEKIYSSMKEDLRRMETDLQDYSKALSNLYKKEIESRRKDTETWSESKWKIGIEAGKQKEEEIDRDRTERMKRLADPGVGLTGKFQDELNMENALENANQEIRFSVQCMKAVTFTSFLGLALLVFGIGILHGLLLQPYVFSSGETAVLFLLYFAILFVLLFVCWKIPYFHYLRRMESCKKTLQKQFELYGRGYQDQADSFRVYVNLLNQIDYINRYSKFLHGAVESSRRISKGYAWHRVQINAHLKKLKFFEGLISIADGSADVDSASCMIDELCRNTVHDVVDCKLYWPEE